MKYSELSITHWLLVSNLYLVVRAQAEWKNQAGGNLRLWGQADKLNWGDQNPVDILQKVKEKCGAGPTCRKDDYSWDTQVVVNGKNVRKKLTVTVSQSSFDEGLKEANYDTMIESLKKLVGNDPWTTSSKQHWDADTESASCPGAQSNYCWIPNKDEGDLDQFSAPVSLYSNYRLQDHSEVSQVRLDIETHDIDPGPWTCENVVEKAGMVLNAVAEIPGFQLLDLYCAVQGVGDS